MSSLFSKALVYLGLVDEDRIDEDASDPIGSGHETPGSGPVTDFVPQGRRVEPPPTSRTAIRPQGRSDTGYGSSIVRHVEVQSDILVVEEFGDARMLADPDLVRRIVDFSSGLIYALDGSMRKVGDGLVLVLPPRVTLSRDEKRRLSGLGAYELEDVD